MKPSFVKLLTLLLVFVCLILLNQSCKKLKDDARVNSEVKLTKHPLEDRFLTVPDSMPDVIKKIAAHVKLQKNKSAFIADIINKVGLPVWDKSLLIVSSRTSNRTGSTVSDSNYVFVPVVRDGTKEVDGALACLVVGDSVSIKFLNEKEYRQYGFAPANPKNAEHLTELMMYLQNKAFGTRSFIIADQRLLSSIITRPDSTKQTVVAFKCAEGGSTNAQHKASGNIAAMYQVIQLCSVTTLPGCPRHEGQVCGDNGAFGTTYDVYRCIDFWGWVDEGGSSGTGGTTGSGGSNTGGNTGGTPTSGGVGTTGTGNTGTTTTNTWQTAPGSVSTLAYVGQTLGQPDTKLSFLNNYPPLCLELYNYLYNTDGILTIAEKNQLLISHIDFLREDAGYLNYCNDNFDVNVTSTTGITLPWFHSAILLVHHYPDLMVNIQNLRLNVQQAYYLLNNQQLNMKIKNYRISNNGQSLSDKETAVKSHINGMLTNPEYAAFVNNYEATDNSGKMWWDRVGYDFAVPPFFWSYQGNNGQALLDNYPNLSPTFQFPLNNNYATLYPRFTEMVMNLKTFVKENPKVMDALQKYSGLTKTQILDHLSFGQGPIINIVEMEGRIGQFKKENDNKTLEIRASYIRGLEQAVLQSTKEGTAFLLAVTILHEYVHYGNFTGKRSEGAYDFGFGFERDAFNVIVEYFNANSVVIKFSKYF